MGPNFVIAVFRNAARVVRKTNPSLRTVHMWVFWCCWGLSFGLVLCSFHRINSDMVLVNVRTTYWLCFVLRQSFYRSYRRSVFFQQCHCWQFFELYVESSYCYKVLFCSGVDWMGLLKQGHTPFLFLFFLFVCENSLILYDLFLFLTKLNFFVQLFLLLWAEILNKHSFCIAQCRFTLYVYYIFILVVDQKARTYIPLPISMLIIVVVLIL